MTLSDWTLSAAGGALPVLDASIKYSGNSSLKCYAGGGGVGDYSRAQRTAFSGTQAQIFTWVYVDNYTIGKPQINLGNYGTLDLLNSAYLTWERFRISFWYDTANNTKWGRVERWNGSAWVQLGTDTNFGSGSPAASALYIQAICVALVANNYVYFDDMEVYS